MSSGTLPRLRWNSCSRRDLPIPASAWSRTDLPWPANVLRHNASSSASSRRAPATGSQSRPAWPRSAFSNPPAQRWSKAVWNERTPSNRVLRPANSGMRAAGWRASPRRREQCWLVPVPVCASPDDRSSGRGFVLPPALDHILDDHSSGRQTDANLQFGPARPLEARMRSMIARAAHAARSASSSCASG